MLYSNCHLGPFPTSVWKLEYVIITGGICHCSAPTSLCVKPSVSTGLCTMVLMGPKAVSINKTLLLLFSQGDNSIQITNESTILACTYAQTLFSQIYLVL